MLYYTVGQWCALAYMMLCGVIMGAIYELFRAVRLLTVAGRVFTAVLDTVMCAVQALLLAAMLLRANGGELRLFALMGCAAGMALFLAGPARLLRAAVARALCLFRRAQLCLKSVAFLKHILK